MSSVVQGLYSQRAVVVSAEEGVRCSTHGKVATACVHQDVQLNGESSRERKWGGVSQLVDDISE